MIGHPNSEAEESKIQIDTGLFVLFILLFVQDRLLWHWLYRIKNTEILLSMNNIEICLTTA